MGRPTTGRRNGGGCPGRRRFACRRAVGIADDEGRFEMSLPPGVYFLSGRSPSFTGGREPCASYGPVTVVDGGRIDAAVFCDRH